MVKILFICHGNIGIKREKPSYTSVLYHYTIIPQNRLPLLSTNSVGLYFPLLRSNRPS